MTNTKVNTRKSTINRTIKTLLVIFGIWPDAPCVTLLRIFWIVTLIPVQISQYRYLFLRFYTSDVFDLMECFSTFIGFMKFFSKIIMFWWNQRIFNKILEMMSEDWEDCADNDIDMRKVASKARISDCIANGIATMHTCAVIFYGIVIILTDVDINDPTVEIPHIYRMEVMFEISTQRMYKFLLVMELIHGLICSVGMGIINTLLLTLTLHVGGQVDILCSWLTKVISIENTTKNHMINKIIEKHQKIIYFAENIEMLYTFIALTQFITNIIMTCLLGFLIITALDNPNSTEKIIRSLSFYSVTVLETFIFCYAGEYLINKCKTIGNAAYDSAWYDTEPKYSHVLLFIILRSQKKMMLTIGKLMDLSLQRFASIMSSSGSYISVLLAMQ